MKKYKECPAKFNMFYIDPKIKQFNDEMAEIINENIEKIPCKEVVNDHEVTSET